MMTDKSSWQLNQNHCILFSPELLFAEGNYDELATQSFDTHIDANQ